jgi:uncharacterized protein
MIIDCHVHLAAMTPTHGCTSDRLEKTIPFRFMRRRLGMVGNDQLTERQFESKLAETLSGTPEIDAAVILAFDGVYTDDGILDPTRTHFHVTNDYVIEVCQRHNKMLFGASVHPFRKDAIKELERCVAAGAVLMKWLPIVQGFDPSDPRCFEFYDALAHHKLPLLSHTGGEKALIRVNDAYAPPRLLEPALKRGVTVIAAHCGTRSSPFEADYFDEFVTLVRRYENLYGDTAALSLPLRMHPYDTLINDPLVRTRVVHGSDWPILPLPPLRLGAADVMHLMAEKNWLRRDVLIKQHLGFGRDYWERGAKLLRLPIH